MAREHTDLGVVPKECRASRSSLLTGVRRARGARERQTPVSYTHLTLPTICSV